MGRRWGGSRLAACWVALISGFVSAAQERGGGSGGSPSDSETLYSTNFDDGPALAGWKFSHNLSPYWAADATPSDFPGGITEGSNGNSLNYNDGASYNTKPDTNWGFALSPPISIGTAVLRFRCNYTTRTTGTGGDFRFLMVCSGDSFLSSSTGDVLVGEILQTEQLAKDGGSEAAGACADLGIWHEHTIDITPKIKTKEVKILFYFSSWEPPSTYDPPSSWLDKGGWAIDDIKVTGSISAPDPGSGYSGPWATIFSANFDGTEPTEKTWTFPGNGSNLWAVDNTPSSFWVQVQTSQKGNPTLPDPLSSVAKSAPNSLNYNNGTNYNTGYSNKGSAKSPMILLTGYSIAILRFWCNYQTETTGTLWDMRIVIVYQINETWIETAKVKSQLWTSGNSSPAGNCSDMGTWHEHTIALDPKWGSIQIEFFFETVDGQYNDFAGWAIDDVTVQVNAPTPTTPSESPAGVAGSTDSSSGGGGGGCGLMGVDLLLPLSLLWLCRRRPKTARRE